MYLGEVLLTGTVAGTNPELSHNPSHAQKLVRPGGIHSSGRLKNSILAVRNDTFVAALVPGITLVEGRGGGGRVLGTDTAQRVLVTSPQQTSMIEKEREILLNDL